MENLEFLKENFSIWFVIYIVTINASVTRGRRVCYEEIPDFT